MVVLILERVPTSLRGELTRWMLEPKAGVFVGKLSAMVRERLWEKACAGMRDGAGLLFYTADTEQGFAVRSWGDPTHMIRDFDGLSLVQIPL